MTSVIKLFVAKKLVYFVVVYSLLRKNRCREFAFIANRCCYEAWFQIYLKL